MQQNQHIAARLAAVNLLDGVLQDGRLMSELIGTLDKLPSDDRARAQRLAMVTLRHLDSADRVLKPFLKKKPDQRVMNILRLGVIELCVQKEASHGVVNAAVTIVGKTRHTAHMKGLVNAVLRRVSEVAPEEWGKLPSPQMPKWLRKPLIEAYGNSTIQKIEVAHAKGAPLDLTPKSDTKSVEKQTDGVALPTGTVRLQDAGQVSRLPGYDTGDWWIQDAAAALPARILNAQPGEKVLDMCAAPGGKTLQLAAAGADVVAVDISEKRMARVQENLDRCGLEADVVVADVLEYQGKFDAILLDAPCSATGTMRRHPDLPYAKDGSDFGTLINLQARMLQHALTLVNPGGRLVYCTCSLLPDEGECQIDDILQQHSNISVDHDALNIQGVDPDWITQEGGLRLRPDFWPDQGGMDGFYMACLKIAD
ncbi:RsmB/NOP family class I SAM-dependent RNA methyltransferase [Parasulfitobacter algicola]|uniref:RsmB/NOP family class I SAM-dependent RNA methyltransferase n=1 Tax=Parasulfitobacter algicola TaxID=2614809 RepID=A0ABX2IX67_9RHOB|nr:RsmB/NOP family class I SAM-dependent RNA methyltransferase [Sulfitobacter algicola]NSX55011.1 RsmB/NOP family class I SAM-dependent RNA methyltransferase [Sulfitobacter algicola]